VRNTVSVAAKNTLGTGRSTSNNTRNIPHISFFVSASEFQTLPKMIKIRNPKRCKGGRTAVLTSCPEKVLDRE
jgi:hypothetical protein